MRHTVIHLTALHSQTASPHASQSAPRWWTWALQQKNLSMTTWSGPSATPYTSISAASASWLSFIPSRWDRAPDVNCLTTVNFLKFGICVVCVGFFFFLSWLGVQPAEQSVLSLWFIDSAECCWAEGRAGIAWALHKNVGVWVWVRRFIYPCEDQKIVKFEKSGWYSQFYGPHRVFSFL